MLSFTPLKALATILPLLPLFAPLAAAVPCVQFDSNFNLYAFGGSNDVRIGAASSFGSPSTTTLTSSGRPPWTGNNTQCLLSQYNNAMYVLGGDASDLSKIYIYNFGSSSWSTQSTTSPPSNLGNSRSASILDHDTNVIFTLAGNTLYQLDMSAVTTTASGSAIAWDVATSPSFGTSGYTPTAAQASNHISYFGVPNTAAGSANMFVIHYNVFQQTAASFPTQNGGQAFPDQSGQAIAIPDANDGVPVQMAFIPNDFSSTYLISHWTNPSGYADLSGAPYATSQINTTQILPAPSSKDSRASYAASPSVIVQIDTTGNIYYLNAISNYAAQSSASWTKMSYSLAGVSGGGVNGAVSASGASASAGASSTSASGSATGSASATRSSASGSASASGSSSATGTSSASAAAATTSRSAAGRVAGGDVLGMLFGVAAVAAGAML